MRAERKRSALEDAVCDPAAPLRLGGLENHLGYFLRRLQVWAFRDFIATLSDMHVRPAQYSVLLVIAANPGQSQSAIGRTLNIERARLARMLHALEARDWLSRASGRDARSPALILPPQGAKALTKLTSL